MDNKKNITEEDKFELGVTQNDLKDSQTTKNLADLQKNNKNIEVVLTKDEKGMSLSDIFETEEMFEPEAVIEPQDQATIKYLSNVKDSNTGEVSQPFNIGNKRYQMVRGIHPSGEIGLAVFCHDDMNEVGENVIHPVEYFEANIAKPMKEAMGMVGKNIQVVDEDTYEGFKHYLVNKQTNEVRKFKTIEEILSCDRMAEEEYMGVGSFKKYMNERLFGARKRKDETLNEVVPTGEESDEEMNVKAKKLMDLISKRIPQNIIKTIRTPIAQREVIAAFAELIGVPRVGLNNLISGIKDISKQPTEQPITEKKVISKKSLEESLVQKKVIKKIKIKDIK
jgi:hypothetical protein